MCKQSNGIIPPWQKVKQVHNSALFCGSAHDQSLEVFIEKNLNAELNSHAEEPPAMTEAEFSDIRGIEEERAVGEEEEESLSCEVDVEVLLQLSEEVDLSNQSMRKAR